MAFCNNCGKQLEGSGKFCVNCGADNTHGSGVAAPLPPAQPMAAAPMQYAPPGGIPMAVGIPAPQPVVQKRGGMMGTLVVLAALAGGGYYYYNHAKTPAPPPAAPSGQNKALVQQQAFTAQWQNTNGYLVLTSAKWTNSSTVSMTSATVQCEQYNADGTDLSQYRVTLNGPTQPNAASTYSNIQIGAIASGMSKVNCNIVHVKPAQ